VATPNPLVEELLKQPREVREAAVDLLLDSLDAEQADEVVFEPEVEDAWRQEILTRESSEEADIPADVVFAEIRAELHKGQ